jgi:hypothetical protein
VGAVNYMGTCSGGYVYQLTNQSGQALDARFTSNGGESWNVNIPPGGSTMIRSKGVLQGPDALIGQPLGPDASR